MRLIAVNKRQRRATAISRNWTEPEGSNPDIKNTKKAPDNQKLFKW